MGSFFTPTERQQTLEKIIAALREDTRIAGAIIVGSAAVGFEDEYSDIDLGAVVHRPEDSAPCFLDWLHRMQAMFSIIHRFEVHPAPNIFLHGFLLEGFLEVDISFQPLDQLIARRTRWKVAFDRTGTIKGIMRSSWQNRTEPDGSGAYTHQLGDIWYFIMHALVSLRRGLPWRALGCLHEIRQAILSLAELNYKKEVRFSRQLDAMPPEFLRQYEQTLVARAEPAEIQAALHAAADCFFDQAQHLSLIHGHADTVANLKSRMRELMEILQGMEANATKMSPEERAV